MFNNKTLSRRRRAFSLPMVMIIALIGFAVSGTALLMYGNYFGRTSLEERRQDEYNALQGAVEAARSQLKEMSSSGAFPMAPLAHMNAAAVNALSGSDLVDSLIVLEFQKTSQISGRPKIQVQVYDSFLSTTARELFFGATHFNEIQNSPTLMARMPSIVPEGSLLSGESKGELESMPTGGSSQLTSDRDNPATPNTGSDLHVYTIRVFFVGNNSEDIAGVRGIETTETIAMSN